MAATLAEEVRKRKVADALNGQDDDSEEEDTPPAEQSTEADTAALAEEEAIDQGATDQGEVPPAAAEKAPSPGYKFVPVTPPAQDVPQNVPQGTFLGEEGADVSPALTSAPVYSTPIEEGNQQYVIDQDTGAKIPRAQLATSEDIAAQPPPSGAEMQRVTVEGQVPRATLVDPDPDEQYFSNPNLANKVKRAQLVDPDPDSLYLPPGTEEDADAQRAALIGRAIKRAALVDPDPDEQYLAAASELEQPPKVQRALGYKFVPVAPAIKRAEAIPAPSTPPAAVQQGGETGVADFFRKRGDKPITSGDDPRLTTVTVGNQNWQVNKEAAPYFQGFLNELQSQGAPIRSDGGWVYRQKVGASGISEHAFGGAIDVNQEGRNQVTPEFQKWIAANPGVLQQAEKRWNIYGGERFGDLGHFEWGGVTGVGAQAAALGGGSPGQAAQAQPKLGYSFKPVVPSAEGASLQQADAFNQQNFRATIAQLPEQNQSLPALINRLDQPIEGVPDAMRQNYQKAVKDEATKYAQDYYGIKDPKEALAKIMSSPDAGTFFGEIKDKALPYLNQAVTAFNQSAVTIDQNRLDMLAKALHPEATLEGRKAFINSITSIPDEATRAATINHLIGTLDPNNPALAALNPVDIADSASRMANPEYQKRQQAEIARQVEANTRALRPDPRLQGTAAGWWADQFAQLPKNVIEGITGPLGQSLMLSEIYQGTVARLRQDNPGMSEDELRARAAGSTMAQIVPAEVLNRLAGGKLGSLTGAIENPVQRIGMSALAHVGIGGAAGAAQQVGINVAEGKPTAEGVLQAAGAGAVQALPGVAAAVVHGAREPGTRPEGIKPAPKDEVVQPPLVTPEKPQLTTRPLSAIDVLGPEPPQTIAPEQADDVLKVVAHNVFPDLNDYEAKQVADRMAALTARNLETDRFRYELERFLPQGLPYSFGSTTRLMQSYRAFQDGPTVYTALELQRAQDAFNAVRNPQVRAPGALKLPIMWREVEARIPQEGIQPPVTEPVRPPAIAPEGAVPVTQEDVARRTYEIGEEHAKSGQPGTAVDDWAQAQEELRATAASGEPVLPASMGDSEPITSAIANRYRDQRIAQGELGPVEAAQGQSTEEQVIKGLQMSPKQRETLINNMMAGKGGNLDLQMSALRAKELYLSEASKAASRDAMDDPTNAAKQQAAQDALAAITDFHNGPLKEGKRIWSDAGRGLQQEIPVDYTTLNGLKEAYLKFQGKSASDTLDPVLSGMAKKAQEAANNERVSAKGWADEIGKYIAGSKLSTDDQVRAELAAIMKNLPCPT